MIGVGHARPRIIIWFFTCAFDHGGLVLSFLVLIVVQTIAGISVWMLRLRSPAHLQTGRMMATPIVTLTSPDTGTNGSHGLVARRAPGQERGRPEGVTA